MCTSCHAADRCFHWRDWTDFRVDTKPARARLATNNHALSYSEHRGPDRQQRAAHRPRWHELREREPEAHTLTDAVQTASSRAR